MNIISFVNITYLRIIVIGYFNCIVYELHVTVHNNYFCITVLHKSFFYNTIVYSTHIIIEISINYINKLSCYVPLMHLVHFYRNDNYSCDNSTPTIITYTSICFNINLLGVIIYAINKSESRQSSALGPLNVVVICHKHTYHKIK